MALNRQSLSFLLIQNLEHPIDQDAGFYHESFFPHFWRIKIKYWK